MLLDPSTVAHCHFSSPDGGYKFNPKVQPLACAGFMLLRQKLGLKTANPSYSEPPLKDEGVVVNSLEEYILRAGEHRNSQFERQAANLFTIPTFDKFLAYLKGMV